MRHVEIILKVTERCNLNCKYCYFFNKENKDFEDHPALISAETVRHLVKFLRTSSHPIPETIFQIDIHGGEPLLLGPARFSEIVSILTDGLYDAKEVRFTVQTNAVLIDETWIDVFSHHGVTIGISIDGPKAQHDANRIDKRGRGTFDRMTSKIAAVARASSEGRLPGFGAICVISPESDARATYACLTGELGFSRLQFLFPDDTHDSINPQHPKQFVKFIEDLFACWANDSRKHIRVQLIDRTLQGILQDNTKTTDKSDEDIVDDAVVFTVSSAGDIGHDDTLRNAVPDLFHSGMTVTNATFPEFLAWHMTVSRILGAQHTAPACTSCTWKGICQHVTSFFTPLHRIKDGIADQPSVYCDALKTGYLRSAEYLARRGVPIERISKNFFFNHNTPIQ